MRSSYNYTRGDIKIKVIALAPTPSLLCLSDNPSCTRRPDSGTLAPSRLATRHVDARRGFPARNGTGTLRESGGCD